jgi:peptidoglycan/LPS O-acetylase OafA/YrhL
VKRILDNLVPPSGGHRFAALDGLRGIAALTVVFGHAPLIGHSKTILGLDARGAVMCFYALSAFLLYYPWAKTGPRDTWAYYRRRVWRIYPAYFLALAFGGVVAAILGRPVTLADLATHLGFVHTWFAAYSTTLVGPAWSLPAEMQFYALLPLFALCIRRWPLVPLILAAIASALLQAFPPAAFSNPALRLGANWPYMAFPFFLGMIAAHLAAVGRRSPWLTVPAIALGGVLYFGQTPGDIALRTALYSLAAFMAVYGVASSESAPLSRLLALRPVRCLGICGYGLFLIHWPLFALVTALAPQLPAFLIGLPLTLALAALCYLYIESPAMRFSRRTSEQSARNLEQVRSGVRVVQANTAVSDHTGR